MGGTERNNLLAQVANSLEIFGNLAYLIQSDTHAERTVFYLEQMAKEMKRMDDLVALHLLDGGVSVRPIGLI